MKLWRQFCWGILMVGLCSAAGRVEARPCRDAWRPCGPESMQGPLRRLIPQGYKGADFRPACQRHDNCYGTLGADKCQCDWNFRQNMMAACNCSRRPRMCRVVANIMYNSTRKRGGDAFARAQRKARARHA